MTADVCVVGAGIAGLTVAYLLSEEGKTVIVLDDGRIGMGETSRTTAHLVNALDDRYFELEKLHGKEGARLAAQSHSMAIDQIEAIVQRNKSIAILSDSMATSSCHPVNLQMSSIAK